MSNGAPDRESALSQEGTTHGIHEGWLCFFALTFVSSPCPRQGSAWGQQPHLRLMPLALPGLVSWRSQGL